MWRPPEEIVMLQESTALYVLAGGKCALVSEALDEGEAKVSVLCDAAVGEGCLAQLSATEVLVAASDGHAMMVFSLPPPPLPTALNTTTSTTSTTSASPSHPLCFTFMSPRNHEGGESGKTRSQSLQPDKLCTCNQLGSTEEAGKGPPIGRVLPPRRAITARSYMVVQSSDGFVGVYLQRATYPLVQMFSPTKPGGGGGGDLRPTAFGL